MASFNEEEDFYTHSFPISPECEEGYLNEIPEAEKEEELTEEEKSLALQAQTRYLNMYFGLRPKKQ